MKSARLMASENAWLSMVLSQHIFPLSVVAADRIEHTRNSPTRFITRGQQIVASPIVAASRGTGMTYRAFQGRVSKC